MTLSFASRAAAQKLGVILSLILIPAVFFGGAFIRQAVQDIRFLEREMLGVELAEMSFPAIESNTDESIKSRLAAIRSIELMLGIKDEEGFLAHYEGRLIENVEAKNGSQVRKSRQMHDYMADVASISGVILDSDSESYHLANMLLITLPVVWSDAAAFERLFLESTLGLSTRAKLSVITGNLEGAFDRQKDSLQRALASSEQPQKYTMMVVAGERLEENIDALTSAVTSPEYVLNQTKVFGLTSGMRRLSHAMVGPTFSLLKAKLETRKQQLERILLMVLAIGVAVSIFVVFLAARLISTTFKKLDAVEEAHRVSEVMREEAERVNSEVADLNVNLSDSLKKLHEAQDELLSKSKMEQLGQLTATVAHEIRNPLGSVRTSAFLIGRKVDAKKMGIDAQLDRINKGVDRCDSIITQLLDFSRVQKISTQASRLDDWLESVVREEGENVSREVAIECHLGLGDMEVGFDQARMRRAIINLINNAAEAMVGIGEKPSMPDGWTPLIRIETLRGKNEVRIIVSDNGPGMTPEVLAKVREPLFTTKNFGTGLGIPAVEQIANQHGGELSISSEVGQGAIFTISIPISQTRSEAA